MSMEEELRQKIYEMHGTVKQLDAKLDAVDEKLESLDDEVEDVEKKVGEVESKAQSNRRKIAAIGGVVTFVSTSLIIASQFFGGVFS